MKNGLMILSCALFLSGLAGCNNNDDNNAADNNDGNGQIQTARVGNNNEGNGNNNDRSMRVAHRAERNIERMGQVDQAHVILANNNAYVAVRLQDDRNSGQNGGGRGTDNGTDAGIGTGYGLGNGTNTADDEEDGNITRNGGGNGFANAGETDNGKGRALNNGTTGTRANQNDNGGNDTGGGQNGDGENGGNDTGNITYSEISTAFEQQIADQVRAADNKVHRVYVSSNPEFFDRMTTYANDIRGGRNGTDLFDGFNRMVNDLFGR
ncbi:YhcN/YlaJ family sporulation lipoprotein [Peribacillus glennii]|uniref:YhcN/YlaJ family sporulation lipoprotein n=1 Tax=Peribacillus glennii TaxID=2303991 RepID=A0A372LEX6_9BACI|nr:YhcN/YlaJ family sporulation lipoprotein [Peribacillus glennii]RFU63850.1 hypothetical protein D0466_10325 [Peribacillus glennii]